MLQITKAEWENEFMGDDKIGQSFFMGGFNS